MYKDLEKEAQPPGHLQCCLSETSREPAFGSAICVVPFVFSSV